MVRLHIQLSLDLSCFHQCSRVNDLTFPGDLLSGKGFLKKVDLELAHYNSFSLCSYIMHISSPTIILPTISCLKDESAPDECSADHQPLDYFLIEKLTNEFHRGKVKQMFSLLCS